MTLFYYAAVVLCVAASVQADGFALNVHRIESPRSKLIRTGKWAEYKDRKSAIGNTRLASSSQPLIDYDDGEYIANVSIGTPPQRFIVLLALSSGALWVPDTACPSKDCPSYCKDAVYCKSLCDPRCCKAKNMVKLISSNLDTFGDCGWRSRFDSRKSSSYRKNGTSFEDVFSADANAYGFIGVDTVTLGGVSGLKVPLQTFGQATSADFSADDSFDGVLGLGSELYGQQGLVPLLKNAKMQKVIPANVVTVALRREGVDSPDLPGGTITYGGVDKSNCDPTVTYIPASGSDPSSVPMDGLTFGSFQAIKTNWTASLGFGATALTGPQDVIDGLAKEAGAVKGDYDFYNIACNATVPYLFIGIGGYSFMIPPEELVRPLGTTDPGCILNVQGGADFFSIGAALGRQYCLVFDNDNVRFGYSVNYYGLAKG